MTTAAAEIETLFTSFGQVVANMETSKAKQDDESNNDAVEELKMSQDEFQKEPEVPTTEEVQPDDDDDSMEGLLDSPRDSDSLRRQRRRRMIQLRPYWLGLGLFLILFAFWILDSLKDPVFGVLVNGNLDKHQPPAKLFSVVSTLGLVFLLEFLSHVRTQSSDDDGDETRKTDEEVLDGGGRWTRMLMTSHNDDSESSNDRVPVAIFAYVGVSYMVLFALLAFLVGLHPSFANGTVTPSTTTMPLSSSMKAAWHVLAYVLYASIESFGSLSVATFWSYSNSTLSLTDAERFYGVIVAIAQLGAIGGSTMVTGHYWTATTLVCVAILVISLQVMAMLSYDRCFPPTVDLDTAATTREEFSGSDKPVFWSGVYLILKHNYVLLILGVSCLYEVSLTCLDYQMKLLGWARFENDTSSFSPDMSFTQFMGRYGQLTNITSLLFSYVLFPFLIQKYGLRMTLRLFPTLLLIATVVAYGALPGNLTVLFVSMSILKAMTYSIHDPSKELLYIPTSNAIKFRAKFWIDVVGARVAKAVGSSINTYAGSVDRSVRVGTVPSLLTAGALWLVCYRVGIAFDTLVRNGTIVGQNNEGHGRYNLGGYSRLSTVSEEDDNVVDSDTTPDEKDKDDDQSSSGAKSADIELAHM